MGKKLSYNRIRNVNEARNDTRKSIHTEINCKSSEITRLKGIKDVLVWEILQTNLLYIQFMEYFSGNFVYQKSQVGSLKRYLRPMSWSLPVKNFGFSISSSQSVLIFSIFCNPFYFLISHHPFCVYIFFRTEILIRSFHRGKSCFAQRKRQIKYLDLALQSGCKGGILYNYVIQTYAYFLWNERGFFQRSICQSFCYSSR